MLPMVGHAHSVLAFFFFLFILFPLFWPRTFGLLGLAAAPRPPMYYYGYMFSMGFLASSVPSTKMRGAMHMAMSSWKSSLQA